jgi:Protein of unknown function (DUF3750)
MKRKSLLLLLAFVLPIGISAAIAQSSDVPWHMKRRDPSGLAPDPATTQEAVIQVYAARTVGWRGALAVHSWISVKPSGAPRYTRYEVIGWGVDSGAPAIRVDRMGPDNYWFGALPQIVLERRGEGVDALIDKLKAAIAAYPYPHFYRTWPGPNSNTFIAYLGRAVPELGLELPANAIGKDFLGEQIAAAAPSGSGYQVSLFGILGLMLAAEEGIELNLLGLTFGLDPKSLGVKLPGLGSLSLGD